MELLYPAYQKFYSALNHLSRFDKEKDFFNNISCLDSFFSEFRNITFVLQKSLKNTQYFDLYKKYCEEYLSACVWIKDKRNETTKEAPFPLIKSITLSLYFPNGSIKVGERTFNISNDLVVDDFLRSLKLFLDSINDYEVFFSTRYDFYEEKKQENIYEIIDFSIRRMDVFLEKMSSCISEKSTTIEKLKEKIKNERLYLIPRDMLMVDDYVYYPKKNEFEKASRLTVTTGITKLPRVPINVFNSAFCMLSNQNIFEKFILMNAAIGSTDLMPTMMIVFNDNTFQMDTYHSSIKTTFYRKINEIAEQILRKEIKEVMYMATYAFCSIDSESAIKMTSKERIAYSKNEYLTFMHVCANEQEECAISAKDIKDPTKILETMYNRKKELSIGANNLLPIVNAFKHINID